MKAIVVDDSRAMRMMLRKFLVTAGFDVVEAAHGRDALAQLAALGAADLALIDWNMPEMNGLELVRAIRQDRRFDRMPLLMVTSETELGRVADALEAGATEYLMKPFTSDALRDKLGMLGIESLRHG